MHPSSELAALYIEELIALGVTYFCIAPGSRSSPLVLACAQHPEAQTFVHFDERGLGFHAVGAASALQKPVCLIVTSGTAVGNLLPAVMEAHAGKIPLLILSADRPAELKDCGANQTCEQREIFAKYCNFAFELPAPSLDSSENFIATTLSLAVHKTLYPNAGPVHINCIFKEPLVYSYTPRLLAKPSQKKAPLEYGICRQSLHTWEKILNNKEKGIIILGSLPATTDLEAIFHLSKKLKWPIFADILSQGRCYPNQTTLIPFYDPILKTHPSLKPDCILHIGDRLVSGILQEYLSSHQEIPHLQLTSHTERQDPGHLVTHQITASIPLFCQALHIEESSKEEAWLLSWKELSSLIGTFLHEFFAKAPVCGSKFFFELGSYLPSTCGLFIGNSLPIRDAEHFFFPQAGSPPIFGQRGVSGIDGNIARMAGTAEQLHKHMIGVIGDQTFLHDLNSLSQLTKLNFPVTLLVLNNQGGRIFSALPVQKKAPHLIDPFFAAAHSYRFEHAAHLFHLPYLRSCDQWQELLKCPQSALIEIPICPEEEKNVREELSKELLRSFARI